MFDVEEGKEENLGRNKWTYREYVYLIAGGLLPGELWNHFKSPDIDSGSLWEPIDCVRSIWQHQRHPDTLKFRPGVSNQGDTTLNTEGGTDEWRDSDSLNR